ncbi:Vacuolar cation/proton exchanger 3 isoform 4, partial [Theobroma cacao]
MDSGSGELSHMENGDSKALMGKELWNGRTAQNMSTSLLRKKSDPMLVSRVRFQMLRQFLANLQEVILGTKLAVLFPAIPLAIAADFYKFGRNCILHRSHSWRAPECNLCSLLCGGLANLKKEQRYDRKQADVNSLLLLLGLLCHMLPLMFRYAAAPGIFVADSTLQLSRASSIVMLVAYVGYIFFQLKTHRQIFESQEEEEDEEKAVIGFWSAFSWLVGMTLIIALLSEYVVGTIEAASESWGISISFISIILIPIVGNAAEHAGAIIFAFKNKLDISLGVAMGSATQISMFAVRFVPLCVVVGWIMGIQMDLDFSLLETGCLALTIIVVAFTLQDGTSHYMKGTVLCLCYTAIAACFFVHKIPAPLDQTNVNL